jgi:hypothetical protein
VWRALRLISTGTGDLDRLPPAVFEALNRQMKSLGTITPLTRPEPTGMKSAACGACRRTQGAIWGRSRWKKQPGRFSGKIFGVAGARGDPNGRR